MFLQNKGKGSLIFFFLNGESKLSTLRLRFWQRLNATTSLARAGFINGLDEDSSRDDSYEDEDEKTDETKEILR